MKTLLLLIAIIIPAASLACDSQAGAKLWYFRTFDKIEAQTADSYDINADTVAIDTTFIDNLIRNPNINEFDKNRYELFYLLAKGSYKAELAGLKSLSEILSNPKYVVECDQKVQLFNAEEVAINLSRSHHLFKAYCNLTDSERHTVSRYYINNPSLYQVDVDAPWDFDACK